MCENAAFFGEKQKNREKKIDFFSQW